MANDARPEFDVLLAEIAVGGGAGLVGAGAIGAAIGAGIPVATRGLVWAAGEFRERLLGHREAVRVVDALSVAKGEIDRRLAVGELVRTDGFFEPRADGRSTAEELLEGILLAAQREYEERKVGYYGRLYASLAFESAIDAVTADMLLRIAAGLSYTQMQLIALIARHQDIDLPPSNDKASAVTWAAESVRTSLDQLGAGGLELVYAEPRGTGLQANFGVPADLRLANQGNALHALMGLSEIADSELHTLANELWLGSADVRPSRHDRQ